MRTIRVRHPGGLEFLEVGTAIHPPVGRGDVRVRLRASSVNYHDYLVATGKIPSEDGRVPMSDGAGEVIEVGEDVTEFSPGDKVMSTFFPLWAGGELIAQKIAAITGDTVDGCAQEEMVAPVMAFTRAPAGYSHAQAATLPCAALTAWRALFVESSLMPGETVLIQGTGGVSIFALQLAKAAGACVIATSSSDEKLERLRALGADHLINYTHDKAWGETAKKLTGGRGVDHVIEIGGAGTLPQSILACRLRGQIAMIGVLAGFAGKVATVAIMSGNVRINGITVGSREHQVAMIRAIETNGIKPVIDSSFPLEGIADAFRRQETGQHFGKICLEW